MAGVFPGAALYPGATVFPGTQLFPAEFGPYYFQTPTLDLAYPLLPHRPLARFYGKEPVGQNVWHDADGWHTAPYTTAEQLAGADAFYAGGRIYQLSSDEATALTAGGFGDYITTEVQR